MACLIMNYGLLQSGGRPNRIMRHLPWLIILVILDFQRSRISSLALPSSMQSRHASCFISPRFYEATQDGDAKQVLLYKGTIYLSTGETGKSIAMARLRCSETTSAATSIHAPCDLVAAASTLFGSSPGFPFHQTGPTW